MVLVLARDTGELGHVLGGLAHRDVDIGQVSGRTRIGPAVGAALGALGGACLGLGELVVVGVGPAVGGALREVGHGLDAGRDEDIAFTGLDGVQRHPAGLQRRRAVAVQGHAGQEVIAELGGHHLGHIESGLAAGLSTTEHQIIDVGGVQRRNLVQGGADHLGGKVVRAHAHQRTLARAADRRASERDDDGLWHEDSLFGGRRNGQATVSVHGYDNSPLNLRRHPVARNTRWCVSARPRSACPESRWTAHRADVAHSCSEACRSPGRPS